MSNIVFLCTGNTCRSPMAEVFFRVLGGEMLTGLKATSAGIFTADGLPASEYAIIAAAELGADLGTHQSSMLTSERVTKATYIVCMTGAHCDRVIERFPGAKGKVFTLSEQDVSDPFGGDLATYQRCAAEIHKGVATLVERLQRT